MFIKIFILFVVSIFFFQSHAQLVNIESRRMQTDSTRFLLTSDLLINYTENNSDYVLSVGSNISTQFKSNDLKNIYFLVGDFDLIRTKNQDFQNSWFLHARYNHKVSELFRVETFIQSQNNTKLTITSRNLLGVGLRLKILTHSTTKVYLGHAYMYEIEHTDIPRENYYNHRSSNYISINSVFTKLKLNVIGTLYFQPLYRDINNFRLLSQFKANIPLTHKISFSAVYNYSKIKFSSFIQDDFSSNIRFGFSLGI